MRDKQAEKVFSYSASVRVLRAIVQAGARTGLPCEFEASLLRITFRDQQHNVILRFRCPPAFPPTGDPSEGPAFNANSQPRSFPSDSLSRSVVGVPPGELTDADALRAYTGRLDANPPAAFVMLIQAGQAALGLTQRGLLREHKIIRKYMVRKSQGKTQISHLKTKGKSRLGSRIRLQQSVEFFEEINAWLTLQAQKSQPQRVLYACAASLWPHVFHCRVEPPFDKKDLHVMKIPRDFNKATLEELEHICRWVLKGRLSYAPDSSVAQALLTHLDLSQAEDFSQQNKQEGFAGNQEEDDYFDPDE